MKAQSKLLDIDQLREWREAVRGSGKTLVVTNGCFDILHAGHVTYLQTARQQGDMLLVGLNSDRSVRALKGADRPLNTEQDRAVVLAALEAVDAVCIFDEVRATRFLESAQPDVYVKGGDFSVDQLPEEERQVVEGRGGKILTVSFVPGKSTSQLLERIREKG